MTTRNHASAERLAAMLAMIRGAMATARAESERLFPNGTRAVLGVVRPAGGTSGPSTVVTVYGRSQDGARLAVQAAHWKGIMWVPYEDLTVLPATSKVAAAPKRAGWVQ